MSAVEHKATPGPWEVDAVTTIDGVKVSASVYRKYDDEAAAFDAEEICRCRYADARLIAASPDLYEALKALLAMCERQSDFNDDGDGLMLNTARAAIAKAGDQP